MCVSMYSAYILLKIAVFLLKEKNLAFYLKWYHRNPKQNTNIRIQAYVLYCDDYLNGKKLKGI